MNIKYFIGALIAMSIIAVFIGLQDGSKEYRNVDINTRTCFDNLLLCDCDELGVKYSEPFSPREREIQNIMERKGCDLGDNDEMS